MKNSVKRILALALSLLIVLQTGFISPTMLNGVFASSVDEAAAVSGKGEDAFDETDVNIEPAEIRDAGDTDIPDEASVTKSDENDGEPEAPVLRAARTQKTIQIDIKNKNGKPLTDEEIGDGFVLSYFERPLSEMTLPASNPNEMTYEQVQAYYDEMMSYMKQTDSITHQGERLTLTMEEGATADDPYIIYASVGYDPQLPPEYVLDLTGGMPAGYLMRSCYETDSWLGFFTMVYDGENLTPQTPNVIVDDEGVYHVSVYYLGETKEASVSFRLDASAFLAVREDEDPAPYPVYARVTLMMLADGLQDQDPSGMMPYVPTIRHTIKTVASDGTVDIQFEGGFVPAVPGPLSTLYVELFSDEGCTQPVKYWKLSSPGFGNSYGNPGDGIYVFSVSPDQDGKLDLYDPQDSTLLVDDVCPEFTFIYEKPVGTISVPVSFVKGNRTDDELASDFFPAYLRATLYPSEEDNNVNFEPITISRAINSADDLNEPLQFDMMAGEVFPASERGYSVRAAFYKSSSSTERSENYYPVGEDSGFRNYLGLGSDGRLFELSYDYGIGQEVRKTYRLSFAPVTVTVKPEPYSSVIDNDNPLYLTLSTGINGLVVSDDIKRTDAEQFLWNAKLIAPVGMYIQSGAWPYEDELCTVPKYNWDGDANDDPYSSEGFVGPDGTFIREQDGVTGAYVLRPYELGTSQNAVSVDIPVHVNIPEGASRYYTFQEIEDQTSDEIESMHVVMTRKLPDGTYSTDRKDVSHRQNASGTGVNYDVDNRSYCFETVDSLDADSRTSINVGMHEPGEYYVNWFMGLSYYEIRKDYQDKQWIIPAEMTKIIIDDEGKVWNEDGTPFVAEFRMKPDYTVPRVFFTIDVNTELPEEYNYNLRNNQYNEYTPEAYRFSLTPLWENGDAVFKLPTNARVSDSFEEAELRFRMAGIRYTGKDYQVQVIPNGKSRIGFAQDFREWMDYLKQEANLVFQDNMTKERADSIYDSYGKIPTINSFYSFTLGNYDNYYGIEDRIAGNPGNIWFWYYWGNLNRHFYTPDGFMQGYPIGDYTISYFNDDWDHKDLWTSDTAKVHLSEDGRFYRIKDDGTYEDEPYEIEIRYIGNTPEEPGQTYDSISVKVNTYIHDGITESDAFTAGDVFTVRLEEMDQGYTSSSTVATGELEITQTGEAVVELKASDGGVIRIKDSYNYSLSWATLSAGSGDPNADWTVSGTNGHMRGQYLVREGMLVFDGEDPFIIPNEYLKLPWSVTSPKEATQYSGDDGITLMPVTSTSQIRDKSHYMVVVQNEYNGKWYALAADENGGNQVELVGITSPDDLKNGWKISESDGTLSYILTAGSVKMADDSVSVKFKTNVMDAAGNILSLKMGVSSTELKPLFSSSSGTVIIQEPEQNGELTTFRIWKGSYATMYYIPELFGRSGFGTYRFASGTTYSGPYSVPVSYPLVQWIEEDEYTQEGAIIYESVEMDDKPYSGRFLDYYLVKNLGFTMGAFDRKGFSEGYYTFKLPEGCYEKAYRDQLKEFYSDKDNDLAAESPYQTRFYILTDNEEELEQEEIQNYTLVKTFGDFVNTYIANSKPSADMIFVYTDQDGYEYAMDPSGLVRVETKPGASGYRKLSTGAEHELIPNNNSGTSANFGFVATDVEGEGGQVIAATYAFRKSRLNKNKTVDYLTMDTEDGTHAWTLSDDITHPDGLVYVMVPSAVISNRLDWDKEAGYKLAVIRNSEQSWLGISEDENGKLQMVTVASESEAAEFKVYSDVVTRYYSSAYGSDLYKYYRVHSIEEINAGDEVVIVYKDEDGKRHIVSAAYYDSNYTPYYGSSSYYAAVDVLEEYSTVDSRDPNLPEGTSYKYRLNTDEYIKKPFAYIDSDNADLLYAQGVTAHAIGPKKTENDKQRKYEYVTPLGDQSVYMSIRQNNYSSVYQGIKTETNFFPATADGEFYMRGNNQGAWLGTFNYSKSILNMATGQYSWGGSFMSFDTVGQDQRISVEVYRRSTAEGSFTVEYHSADGELVSSEVKPMETFALTQKTDEEKDGEEYIFVGWTVDPERAGYLGLDDSANLFDYDDVAKLASLKSEVKSKYKLLGDCDPQKTNLVDYSDVEDYVVDDVLKLYPVFARRGFSNPVTASEGDRMIVGVMDFKDNQMGGAGSPSSYERWLGSINIEIYRDGGIWVPSTEAVGFYGARPLYRMDSVTVIRNLRAPLRAAAKATMYFAYHNDDAADLNIKFIEDGVTAEQINDYLSDSVFDAQEPTHNYVIDAVSAEQGGSEDGLKYRYNWLSPLYGGQLDNVRGGSTVRIYVTTKYQIKYYLDIDDGNGYVELTSDKYLDNGFYTTAGTENAVAEVEEGADYVVTSENEYKKLIEKDLSDTTTFVDDPMARGEYSAFLYKFNDYPHTIDIPALPEESELPAEAELDKDVWTVLDKDLEELLFEGSSSVQPSSQLTVTDTTYGTGNTVWSYENEGLSDVTNTYHLYVKVKTDKTDIEITKMWNDVEDQDEIRPTAEQFAAYVRLMNGETEVTGYEPEIVDNGDSTYTVRYTELPRFDEAGTEITYAITETDIAGYQADPTSATDGGTITNTHEPENATGYEKVSVSGRKIWNDSDDQDGIRPESVTVDLYADGVKTDSVTVTEKDGWKWTFEGLPKYDGGNEIEYTMSEQAVSGYKADKDSIKDGETIINTHEPEKVSVSGSKKWDDSDDQDGIRPESIAVDLYANGDKVDSVTVTEEDGWKWTFEGLPKYDGGDEIEYTMSEQAVSGYKADKDSIKDGETIINTHEPEKVSVSGSKKWDDSDDQDGIRPQSITVDLYADGVKTDSVTVTEKDGWKWTFEGLPKYDGGDEIEYTMSEQAVSGYKADKDSIKDGETITNTHAPEQTPPPVTDDASRFNTWFSMMIGSIMLLGITLIIRKRQKDQ